MKPSSRLERIPPYLFAELERKIAAKKEQGVDVISLGIGDPDTPSADVTIEALQKRRGGPRHHQYPSNRGRPEFREAVAAFYERRFGVTLDPATEVMPAIGSKECVFNLNLAVPRRRRRGAGAGSRLPRLHRRPAPRRRRARAACRCSPSASSHPTSARCPPTRASARG